MATNYKRTSEFFGQKAATANVNSIVNSNYLCPFINKRCNKQSRLINYPMGVCSVHVQGSNVIICPARFEEKNIVFSDIAKTFFGSPNNTIVFSEVKITNIGSFDFVIVKHKTMSPKVDDFVVVEFQSDSTTGTGELVKNLKDFISKSQVKDRYNFGMNTYNTIKLGFIQMLMKGQVMEYWRKNIVWVMQDYIFSNMTRRFFLDKTPFTKAKFNHFFIYDLKCVSNQFILRLEKEYSSTIEELSKAFQRFQGLPLLDEFVRKLEKKIQIKLYMK